MGLPRPRLCDFFLAQDPQQEAKSGTEFARALICLCSWNANHYLVCYWPFPSYGRSFPGVTPTHHRARRALESTSFRHLYHQARFARVQRNLPTKARAKRAWGFRAKRAPGVWGGYLPRKAPFTLYSSRHELYQIGTPRELQAVNRAFLGGIPPDPSGSLRSGLPIFSVVLVPSSAKTAIMQRQRRHTRAFE
jgi:hypothetical protein